MRKTIYKLLTGIILSFAIILSFVGIVSANSSSDSVWYENTGDAVTGEDYEVKLYAKGTAIASFTCYVGVYQILGDSGLTSSFELSADLTADGYSGSVTQKTPSTSPTTQNITVNVLYGNTSDTITPTKYNTLSKLYIGTLKVKASSSASSSITFKQMKYNLGSGYVATNTDSSYSKTISVTGPSSDVELSLVKIGNDTLSASGKTYSYTMPNENSAVANLSLTAGKGGKIVSVDTSTINDSSTTQAITLGAKGTTKNVSVVVKAQDGSTTDTFTVAISRPASSNTSVTGLTITQAGSAVAAKLFDASGNSAATFSASVKNYTVKVSEGTTSLKFEPTLADTNASYKLNNVVTDTVAISSSTTSVTMSIIAQNTTTILDYTFNIERLSDDTKLSSLSVSTDKSVAVAITPSFSATTNAYTGSIAYADGNGFSVNATANNAKATVTYSPQTATFSQKTLDAKTITVTVTSESGLTEDYTVSVTRQAADTDLTYTLTINGETSGAEYTKDASSTVTVFTYYLPASEVNAVASLSLTSSTTTSSGIVNGGKYAVSSSSSITFVITAQDDSKETITVRFLPMPDTDNSISSFDILNPTTNTTLTDAGGAQITFNPTTTSYIFTVPYNQAQIDFKVTPTKATSIVTGAGLKNLTAGTVNHFTIYVTSQSGSKGTEYTFDVTRIAANSDSTISDLKLDLNDGAGSNTITGFSPSVHNYSLRVEHNISSVDVAATIDPLATIISGTGVRSLAVGLNVINVVVKAEDGTQTQYSLNITRAEDKNTITSITISNTTYSFDPTVTSSALSVPFTVGSVDVEVTTNASYATVTGAGTKTLLTGPNVIKVFATSELGTKGTEYSFTITRDAASSNSTLTDLKVDLNDGSGLKTITGFSSSILVYNLVVGHNTTSIDLACTASTGATIVSGNGTKSLTLGKNTISIVVTAEDSSSTTYTVNVQRAEDKNTITGITISNVSYTFNASETLKTFTVPYTVTSVEVNATTDALYGVLSGTGTKPLTTGTNEIKVYVTSELGTKGTEYTFRITRESASSLSTLIDLKVNIGDGSGATTVYGFSSSTHSYQMTVSHDTTSVEVIATACTKGVVVSGNGTKSLNLGVNQILIVVKAEDDSSTTYTLTVNRAETKNSITNITISNTTYSFDPSKKSNEITVGYTVTSVVVSATTDGTYAVLSGTGTHVLAVGANNFAVFATSELGIKGTEYTFNIIRENPLPGSMLTDIKINNTSVDGFESTKYHYTLRVEHNVTSVQVNAEAISGATIISGLGTKSLTLGKNVCEILVNSYDNATSSTYTLDIYRAEDKNKITNIKVSNTDYTFDESTTSASLNVPYSVTAVEIEVTAEGTYKTITGAGTHTLTVGINKFSVYATSEYGTVGTKYEFEIIRAAANSDSSIVDLSVTFGTSTENKLEGFDPTKTTYSIVIGKSEVVSVVYINAEATSLTSVIYGTGKQELTDVSDSTVSSFAVTCTAEDGSSTTYNIYISRSEFEFDKDNSISSVIIYASDGNVCFDSFDASKTSYEVVLSPRITSIVVDVNLPSGSHATVKGKGNYRIDDTTLNLTVYATSQSGEKGTEYSFVVSKRVANNDASLADLQIDGTTLSSFAATTFAYKQTFGNSVESVDILATPKEATTTAVIQIDTNSYTDLTKVDLEEGKSKVIKVICTAEDNSVLVYTVELYRSENNAALKDLYAKETQFVDKDNNVVVFDSAVKDYYLYVNFDMTSVEIVAESYDSTADIRGTGVQNLSVGENIIQVTSIPATGNYVYVYTVHAIRYAEATSNIILDKIVLNNTKTFDSTSFTKSNDGYYYTDITVPCDTTAITAKVTFVVGEYELSPTSSVIGGKLSFGKNTVLVVAVASDKTTTNTYMFNVTREKAVAKSFVCTEIADLITEYSSSVNSYNYLVSKNVDKLHLSFTFDSAIKVVITNKTTEKVFNSDAKLVDGVYTVSDSDGIELKTGYNNILIQLAVGNEVSKEMNMVIYKEAEQNQTAPDSPSQTDPTPTTPTQTETSSGEGSASTGSSEGKLIPAIAFAGSVGVLSVVLFVVMIVLKKKSKGGE